MSRLAAIYKDLHALLIPLLPADDYIMSSLTSPLSPTTAPLHSSQHFLHEILVELKKRSSAHHDVAIDTLLDRLSSTSPDSALPALISGTMRAIFELAESMVADVRSSKLSKLSQDELSVLLVLEASRREYELVTRLYGGVGGVKRMWSKWFTLTVASTDSRSSFTSWKRPLLETLSRPVSISIAQPPTTDLPPESGAPSRVDSSSSPSDPPTVPPLPAPFLIPAPTLFRIQNHLQATAITACLILLAFPSSPSMPSSSVPIPSHPSTSVEKDHFASRIWSLLTAEIDRGGFAPSETKLINLEDEVWDHVQRRQSALSTPSPSSSSSPSEAHTRAHVQRLLRSEDPVFNLYMRRLVDALDPWLSSLDHPAGGGGAERSIPSHMRTGRRAPPSAPTSVNAEAGLGGSVHYPPVPPIRGLDTPVLVKACNELAKELGVVVQWVEAVWADVTEPANLASRASGPSSSPVQA